jgi:hypothetical protein
MVNKKDIFTFLKGLPNDDNRGQEFLSYSLLIDCNTIDCRKSIVTDELKIGKRGIFVNHLDLSQGSFNKVILIGQFNRVDMEGAEIKSLDISKANIIKLDRTEANIRSITGKLPGE